MSRLLILLCFLLAVPHWGLAQEATSNEFVIRVFGGNDLTPPTIPVLGAATTTPTQIDLSWSTSTDNFAVSGYRVWRGPTVIATTTLLTFFDTGLTPSTTYAYRVQAFDAALNYSGFSNTATVTTPAIPITPPPVNESAPSATAARVALESFALSSGLSTTSVELVTAFPSRIEFRYGRTADYELGYLVGGVYRRGHFIALKELEPGTTYVYQVVGITSRGIETVLREGSFRTEEPTRPTVVPNVNQFTGEVVGQDVVLRWTLPAELDPQRVRIVRSHLGFPAFPTDGAIVYQGLGTGVTDVNILTQYSPVYYTAFVYDGNGNVSSGAIVLVYAESGGEVSEGAPRVDLEVEVTDQATSTINTERLQPGMKMPLPADISVTQGEVTYRLDHAPLVFEPTNSVIVSVPVDAVSGNLKSIIVSVLDPTNHRQQYAYLLRINADRTAYEAAFNNQGVVGQSQLKLQIYDYEAFAVATYQTPLHFVATPNERESASWRLVLSDRINIILLTALFATTIFLIFLLVRREREEEEEEEDEDNQ